MVVAPFSNFRIAAILLDTESRSTTLDADSFLRSMEATFNSPEGWVKLKSSGIGQAPYGSPSVFSFFLPEYQPPGVIEQTELVSPESQVLTGKHVTSLVDGLFTAIKFGLISCYNGFGDTVQISYGNCPSKEGSNDSASGYLGYTPPSSATMDEIIDDLALILRCF